MNNTIGKKMQSSVPPNGVPAVEVVKKGGSNR